MTCRCRRSEKGLRQWIHILASSVHQCCDYRMSWDHRFPRRPISTVGPREGCVFHVIIVFPKIFLLRRKIVVLKYGHRRCRICTWIVSHYRSRRLGVPKYLLVPGVTAPRWGTRFGQLLYDRSRRICKWLVKMKKKWSSGRSLVNRRWIGLRREVGRWFYKKRIKGKGTIIWPDRVRIRGFDYMVSRWVGYGRWK